MVGKRHMVYSTLCDTPTFCESGIATMEHLFFSWENSCLFWEDFHSWILANNLDIWALIYSSIKFGFVMDDRKLEFSFNNLLILVKYLYKRKLLKVTPRFTIFFKRNISPFRFFGLKMAYVFLISCHV